MVHPRKTFDIQELKDYINNQLKRTDTYADDGFKAGLSIALEHVLINANCYHGYTDNYWQEKGCKEWHEANEPEFPEKEKFIYGPTGQKYNRHYY